MATIDDAIALLVPPIPITESLVVLVEGFKPNFEKSIIYCDRSKMLRRFSQVP